MPYLRHLASLNISSSLAIPITRAQGLSWAVQHRHPESSYMMLNLGQEHRGSCSFLLASKLAIMQSSSSTTHLRRKRLQNLLRWRQSRGFSNTCRRRRRNQRMKTTSRTYSRPSFNSLFPVGQNKTLRGLGLSQSVGYALRSLYAIPHRITSCISLAGAVKLKAKTPADAP